MTQTEARYSELIGKVIYFTDYSDESERIARLTETTQEGCILEDILPPTFPQWYSWVEVGNFKLAPQEGWE